MKKIILLGSALVLAACGGGGSNHAGGSSVPGGYVPPRPVVSAATAVSNAEITNMSSEIVVASNSSSPVFVGSESIESGGVTYTSYRLDDVKLLTAENLETSGHSYVNLILNATTGEIDAVKMVIGGEDSGRIERNALDTHIFSGPIFEYVPDGDDKALYRVVDNGQDMAALTAVETANSLSGGHWNRVDEQMVFGTNGNSAGLQYSDFGHFNPIYRSKNKQLTTDAEIIAARNGELNRSSELDKYRSPSEFNDMLTREDYQLFAGGYAISGTTLLDTLTPDNSTSYAGKAVGRVYTSIQSGGGDRTPYLAAWNVPFDNDTNDDGIMDAYSEAAGHDIAKAYATSGATMTIGADGTQTLVMPFNTQSDTADTFYDITITKPTDAEASMVFTGTPSEAQYRMNTTPNPSETKQEFTAGYYGVNTPAEAAGTARYYTEQDLDTGVTREWEMQAAYGMKKQ